MKTSRVALASLLFTLFFFAEYIPPVRNVHIPYDLEGFHYPLADAVLQDLKQGHLPQWDPTIYCGISLIANIQAAIFYPPTWLMYAASLGREHLSYQALQDLVFAHVWVAFLLYYCWLRDKRPKGEPLHWIACVMGAGVFAYSGYMCTQLQHFGLVGAYTWMPLGLWGVDQAFARRSWRPLWKVMLASALAFLAGYPPTWFVFMVCLAGYATFSGLFEGSVRRNDRLKILAGVAMSLVASLGLVAVQLLPTFEASRLLDPDPRYGGGIAIAYLLREYLLPNFYDFSLKVPVNTNFGRSYFYLGAPAIIALLFVWRRWRDALPTAAMGAICLILVTNPFGLVWMLVQHSNLLASMCRDWYFLAGVTMSLAALTAYGLDLFLTGADRAVAWVKKLWVTIAAIAVAISWAIFNLIRWQQSSFAAGAASTIDAIVAIVVFGLLLCAIRGAASCRNILTAALILSVGIDYKAFGTSKRFDAGMGSGPHYSVSIPDDLGAEIYQQMYANAEYRVLLEEDSLLPAALRSVSLTTPLGFDPLIPSQFRRVVEANGSFSTDRTFAIDPSNHGALHLFGVRYFIARVGSPLSMRLSGDSNFSKLEPKPAPKPPPMNVFEYRDARPPFSWESSSGDDTLKLANWRSDQREFSVHSAQGGRLRLAEQFYPGWSAKLDGQPVEIARWSQAFQSVDVPAGEHRVQFEFHSRWLGLSVAISLLSTAGLLAWIWASRRDPQTTTERH